MSQLLVKLLWNFGVFGLFQLWQLASLHIAHIQLVAKNLFMDLSIIFDVAYISLLVSVMVTIVIVWSPPFKTPSRPSGSILPLSLGYHSWGFQVCMSAIIFLLRSAAFVSMASGLLIEAWNPIFQCRRE